MSIKTQTAAIELGSSHPLILERRAPIATISSYLERVVNQMSTLRYVLKKEFCSKATFEILDRALPSGNVWAHKKDFIDDIIRIVEQFFQRSCNNEVTLKIEVVRTDMCRLFHIDQYRQRLLCTYMGPGTEWLDDNNVNHNGLGSGCNSKIVKEQHKINRAQPFEVLLIEGSKNDRGGPGVVHRSPPIQHKGLTRVLLKIDE